MVYKGGGKYALADSKNDSDDEELYSKDLFMNVSEDDEEEQIVIISNKKDSKPKHRDDAHKSPQKSQQENKI